MFNNYLNNLPYFILFESSAKSYVYVRNQYYSCFAFRFCYVNMNRKVFIHVEKEAISS